MIDICDFCSSGSFCDGFSVDSVVSAMGGTLSLGDREFDLGDTEGSGVGSEDLSGLGVAETRLLRGFVILCLFLAA